MTDTKTPGTETDNNEDQKQPSDARIILGPLVKYAAMGFVIVSIIITTAVMLDHQFNDIDREVAELEAQLAQARKNTVDEVDTDTTAGLKEESIAAVETVAVQQEPVISEPAKVNEAEKPAVSVVDNNVDAAAQAVETETNTAVATVAKDLVTEDAVVEAANNSNDFFDKSMDDVIAERNTYLKERDRVYLEEFKASQEKQLQFMRERLVRQEKRIEQMEKRNQEIYDYRAANVKERQQKRESSLADRI